MEGSLAPYTGARVIVLGASGFLGRWVARCLTLAGARVVAAVRDPAGFADTARRWGIDAEAVSFDAQKPYELEDLIGSRECDIVFNLVGYGVDRSEVDPTLMALLNEKLPLRVGEALQSRRSHDWPFQRLVHVGSALEYGLAEGVLSEATVPQPHTAYGRSKLAGTLALSGLGGSTGLRCVTARVFTVFGAGEHPGRLLPSLRSIEPGQPVELSTGAQSRDFAYAEDVAEGLLRLGTASATTGETVNLATGTFQTVRHFATVAAGVLGIESGQLAFGSRPLRPDEMTASGVSVDRLRSLVSWVPDCDLSVTIPRAVRFEAALPA